MDGGMDGIKKVLGRETMFDAFLFSFFTQRHC